MKKISDLYGKNIVVYDCEIKNEIGKNGVTWSTHHKMGISVACLFDYLDGDIKVFLDDNIQGLHQRLSTANLIVGYNHISFDNQLVYATLQKSLPITIQQYDMCQMISAQKSSRVRLNEVLEATFKMKKTEDGADAPIFYQRGEIGKLISYCLADVRRERMAFEYAYLHGHLKTGRFGDVKMRCPLEMLRN